MSVTVSPVVLWNLERGYAESAELWDAITEQQLADWEAEWMPELFRALQRLHRAGVPRQAWPQSRYWDWRRKIATITGMLAHSSFSIVCSGVTQGMMIVNSTTQRCRLEDQAGKNLVYVEYVENAPWNRKELFDSPRYRGVGSLLMRAAIEASRHEGFKGRIGLHSLPQADTFYAKKCGMTDLGMDPDYSLMHYFEMTQEQAEAFVAKGGKA